MAREQGLKPLLRDYVTILACAWCCENFAIRTYEHYWYSTDWHLFIDRVPLFIVLIWPLVILSGVQVVTALRSSGSHPGWLAVFVGLDASLVEVVATNSGLWTWAEGGHLNVPFAGIAGWAAFAAASALCLKARSWIVGMAATIVVTHGIIVATWWGGLKWVFREPVSPWVGWALTSMLAFVAAVCAVKARRSKRGIELSTAVPRLIATSVFLYLMIFRPGPNAWWIHLLIVAVPYLVATKWLPQKDIGGKAGSQP